MANIVNNKGLPSPFVEAITFSDFLPAGNFSAYRIQEAPQITKLKKDHSIDEDASDKIWMLISRALLQVIENGNHNARNAKAFATTVSFLSNEMYREDVSDEEADQIKQAIGVIDRMSLRVHDKDDRYMIRQTMSMEVSVKFTIFKGTPGELEQHDNVSVFDTIPLYDKEDKILYYPRLCDVTHAYKAELREVWIREANIQAEILRSNGHEVDKIIALMIFKDWNRFRPGRQENYPKSQLETMSLPVREKQKVQHFIIQRAAQHLRAKFGDVAECSPSDRWAEADSFVVVRPGSTRALKRTMTYDEAVTWLASNRARLFDAEVKKIPGKSRRCDGYCPVSEHCKQWQKLKQDTFGSNTKDE